jgi:hypothetical protein
VLDCSAGWDVVCSTEATGAMVGEARLGAAPPWWTTR